MSDFQQLITNNIGALLMAVVFVIYLIKREQMMKCTLDSVTRMIENHLTHAVDVEKEVAVSLEKLSNNIESLGRQIEKKL